MSQISVNDETIRQTNQQKEKTASTQDSGQLIAMMKFPKQPATVLMSVVLRDLGDTVFSRYVTHCRNDEDGSYFWGHYFSDLSEAHIDFITRCQRHVVMSEQPDPEDVAK